MPDPLDSISPKSTHPRPLTRDFTDSEDQVEALPVTSTPASTSIEAREYTSREITSPDPLELNRRDSVPEQGSQKPILPLPRPNLGHLPPRKKSQMDWLHGRHPSQLQEGSSTTVGAGASADAWARVVGTGSAIGAGLGGIASGPGSGTTIPQPSAPPTTLTSTPLHKPRKSISGWTPKQGERESSPLRGDDEAGEDDIKPIPVTVDVEEMPSAAVVAAAAGKPKAKRSKQKASIKPSPAERFYGTSNKDRDPFGSDDDDAPTLVPGISAGAGTEEWDSKLPTMTMAGLPNLTHVSRAERELKEGKEEIMSEGVGSSMGGDGEVKKKRTNKKKGEAGPGKAWRKGLKDVDRLAGRTPGTHSASSSVEPQAAPSSSGAGPSASKKRKQMELIALPMPGLERPKMARKGSSMVKGSEREVSDPDDELAELLEGGPLNRRRPSLDSSNDEADKPQTTIKPPQPPMPVRPETTGLTKAQLRAPADLENLGHPIYSKHIPGKALPVYRIPSPVRNKEKELAVPLPLRDQVGPGPRGWQVGTRIVLGVGGAHLRLKSWMSTGASPFTDHKRAVAEQARLAHAQAMYQQQQPQLNGSQQSGYEQQQPYVGVSGWQAPPIPAVSSPYPLDSSYSHPYPQAALPGTQQFTNPLSPLPLHSGQMSPAQLPFQPPGGDRAIYTAMPPLAGAKPKGKKRAAPGDGRSSKAKKAKKPFEPMGDLMTMPSGPTTPMPLPLAGSSPILLPAASTSVPQPGQASSPVQLTPPSVPPHHIAPPEGFTAEGAAPPPKLKGKRSRPSAAEKCVTADAMLGLSDDNDNFHMLKAVPMAKQESGDSLDKEMEDLL